MKLREYQSKLVVNLREAMAAGARAPLAVLPTGGGKTVIFTFLAANVSAKGKRVLILVHRIELIRQTCAALDRFGVEYGVINPNFTPNDFAPVQVASIQSVAARLHKIRRDFDLVIVDECFPAGTMIDGRPIETIGKGDIVSSFNHDRACTEMKQVISTSKRMYEGDWYRLTFSDGSSVVCTENHTFYTSINGYVSAKQIFADASRYCKDLFCIFVVNGNNRYMHLLRQRNAEVETKQSKEVLQSEVSRTPFEQNQIGASFAGAAVQGLSSSCGEGNKAQALGSGKDESGVLFGSVQGLISSGIVIKNCSCDKQEICFGANEAEQSYEQPRRSEQNDGEIEGADISFTGREWETNFAANRASQCDICTDGICNRDVCRCVQISIPSKLLQGRFGISRGQVSNRSGWKDSPIEEVEVFGREKIGSVDGVRLVDIEVYKRASGFRPSWVPDSNWVYNVGVEGNHNYFANGVLVHNCHHATADSWRWVLNSMPAKSRILGVTATPCRGDGTGLGSHVGGLFDAMVEGPQIDELIGMGFLVEPEVFAPTAHLDMTALRKLRDSDKGKMEKIFSDVEITGDAIEHYTKHAGGLPAVAFCVSVKHAQLVAEQFRKAGYNSAFVDGAMDDWTRKKTLDGLADGSMHVVTSCDLISEGFDLPAISCAILLRQTKSLGLYLQQVGRALRPVPGKQSAIILDHAGNSLLHGLPDERRDWTLDGVAPRETAMDDEDDVKALRIVQCEHCYHVHVPTAPGAPCPNCGHVKAVKAPPTPADGELRKLTAEEKKALEELRKATKRTEVWRAKTREQLEEVAARNGYKRGWVDHILKSRADKHAQ